MKRTIIIFCMTLFGFNALFAAPSDNERLTGAWSATVEYNRSFDTYKLNLAPDGSCTVKVSNGSVEQETAGSWSWDGSLFRLYAAFKNVKIPYLNNIQWTSVLNLADGGRAFSILGKPGVNGPQTRFSFFRQEGGFDEKAIPRLFSTLCEHILPNSRLAVVGLAASDPNEGTYYLNELTLQFVNARKYTVVDRRDIDAVLFEQDFQMSGYVDDDAFVSIGKFIGAEVVITGSINGTGPQKRIVIKAIDVLTSEILSMASTSL
ncbi:MAG: CsgG/HfaB family protein [Treponema sp.]|jgi:hypothetical protein|nr:CsgG/HfaB family protein [Treponema sp.]